MRTILLAGLVLLATAAATGAEAHAHLLKATPAAGSTAAAPGELSLSFNERLIARFSGFTLSDAKGRAVPLTTKTGADAKTLTAAPKAPLAAGRYSVKWSVVSADTHRMQGGYDFSVK